MKTALVIFASCFLYFSVQAQYYLRGEVQDEKGSLITNARIILHSTGFLYSSGSDGSFGIVSSRQVDSVTVSQEGYQPKVFVLTNGVYQVLKLKQLQAAANATRARLVSVTKNFRPQDRKGWVVGGETYSSLIENEFIPASTYPESGFAIHTDKASYSNIRRFLNMNTMIPPDAVRTEEVLNYFDFDYKAPPKDSVFGYESVVTDCPWNDQSKLLLLKVDARKLEPEKIPPSNLVFLIDVSGSMDLPNRLPLLKSAFKLLVNNLRDKDTVSIVVYGSAVGVWLPPISGKEKDSIRRSIEGLFPVGSTPGESGIRTAYQLAKNTFIKGGNNRVILATDGDFNVGQSTEDELDKLITQHQQLGIYLTCLGVGMGNYKDSKLEVLAKKGNGNFAYLDNEAEAEKVLVKELTQTLYTVADDAYLNIAFNSKWVQDYRLIGYDNKTRALADSLSQIEGGEVGSGHSLMALIELKTMDDIQTITARDKQYLGSVSISYKNPGDSIIRNSGYVVPLVYTPYSELPQSYRFATSLSMFTAMLKESEYAKKITWSQVIDSCNKSIDPNNSLQKEFLQIVEKARKIYLRQRKRKAGAN